MTDERPNHFRRLWNLGYTDLLPVVPHDCGLRAAGKRPGVKGDNGWYGTSVKKYEATLDDLGVWSVMGAGVGLRCNGRFIGIDIDTLSKEWSPKIVRAALKMLGPAPRRVGQPPKTLLLYRISGPLEYSNHRFDDGVDPDKPGLVEVLTGADATKWFVMLGIHPKTGRPYDWTEGLPPAAELTEVTPDQVRGFMEALRENLPKHKSSSSSSVDRATVDQASLKGDFDLLRSAMLATPNDPSVTGYKEWSDMAVALRGATQDDPNVGLDLFCEWSERAALAEHTEDAERVYHSFQPPFSLGADYVYATAERLGQWPGRIVSTYFQADADESIFPTEQAEAKPTRKYKFERFNDAADSALDDHGAPLIKGLLDQGAMTVLYGPSNVGKTFVAMDMAYHVAAGMKYAGMKTARGCVLYVAAEGGRGAKRRVRALRDKFPGVDVEFLLLASGVDLRRADADLKPLISAIQALGVPVLLIVVDTLSRAMAGGDENSSVDMGHIVTHFDALRAHTSAHLLIVHHSGKNTAAGARGHSLLRAATDTEIEISEGLIEVTKQRDLDKSWSSGFMLDVRTLGVDADGDPITSCTVRLMRRDSVQVGAMTEKERDGLKCISELDAFATDSEAGVSAEDVVSYYENRGETLSISGARALLKRLVSKNCITKTGRGRWTLVKSEVDKVASEVASGVFE